MTLHSQKELAVQGRGYQAPGGHTVPTLSSSPLTTGAGLERQEAGRARVQHARRPLTAGRSEDPALPVPKASPRDNELWLLALSLEGAGSEERRGEARTAGSQCPGALRLLSSGEPLPSHPGQQWSTFPQHPAPALPWELLVCRAGLHQLDTQIGWAE